MKMVIPVKQEFFLSSSVLNISWSFNVVNPKIVEPGL